MNDQSNKFDNRLTNNTTKEPFRAQQSGGRKKDGQSIENEECVYLGDSR
jgi:hypothetical protein